MTQAEIIRRAVAVLVCAAVAAGCGRSESGGPVGTGGVLPGTGGGSGIEGTGGAWAAGGSGTGGSGTGGSGTGGSATGGRSGTGGSGTQLSGSGGRGSDAGVTVPGMGGSGTGGAPQGGAGGAATGGASGSDGGVPDAAPVKCSDLTTQAACEARTTCHSVFVDPQTCGCASPGCCARFDRCADAGQADCVGPALCKMMQPFCESPYTIAFSGSCYEGCVTQTVCALPACPPSAPAAGSACGPLAVEQTCYYEDCAGAGRTVATCAAGAKAWEVKTSPCAAIACEDGNAGEGLTCAAGKICVITRSIGGALIVTSACVEHSCGAGPIAPACVPGLNGLCTPSYSTAGAVFRCDHVVDCGFEVCA